MGERLSIVDTMFLTLEQMDPCAHMHIGAALVFDPLPGGGAPDFDEVRELIATRIGMLPRFGQVLSGQSAGPLKWLTWEPAARLDVDAHMHHAVLPAPGDDAVLREWLSEFWSHRLDRSRPLWEMTLLEGLEGGRWAMATKTHHCLVDGVGSLDIGDVLLDTEPDAPLPPPHPLRPGPAGRRGGRFWLNPNTALRVARGGATMLLRPRQAMRKLWAAGELTFRNEIIGAPHTSLNDPLTGARRFEAVRIPVDAADAIRAAHGGTINDVVLAICAGGLRELLLARGEDPPRGGLRAQVPVNIRTRDRAGKLGNELTSLFVELPVDEADPLRRYDRVLSGASRAKSSTQRTGGKTIVDIADAGPPLAGELLAWMMFGMPRMFNLTITNVPGPKEQRYVLGAPLTEILPLVPLFSGHAVGIAVVSYGDRLTIGINADRIGVPDIENLRAGMERAVADLLPDRGRGGVPAQKGGVRRTAPRAGAA